jgi:hypothetical protein
MKKTITGIAAVLGALFLGFLIGCADAVGDAPSRTEDGMPVAGMGRVLVHIGPRVEGARTLMPALEDVTYRMTFSSETETVGPLEITDTGGAVDLWPGIWELSVTGYMGETEALEGYETGIEVKVAESTQVTVMMKGKIEGDTGTLAYSITFPDTASRGWLRVYGWDDAEIKETVDLVNGATADSGTKTKAGSLNLSSGYYHLGIDIYMPTGVLSRSDIAHIYPGLTTETGTGYAEFTAADFVPAEVDSTKTSLAAVLDGISGLPTGVDVVYTLPAVDDNNLNPRSITHTGNVTVTVDGGGRTVSLYGSGSLITIGSGVTLKLKNITLRGSGMNNDASLITVDGGNLELNDGAVITGNTKYSSSTSSYGGGVYIDSGTFIMNGGAITRNTARSYGGGVYVGSGTFTMNGGTITHNTATYSTAAPSYGGGVYVDSGTFTMNGGVISDNKAESPINAYGGGMYVNSGTFAISGGAIMDNTAVCTSFSSPINAYGGGMYVNTGIFTMSGGTISGNTASSCGASGGGVYVSAGGGFTLSGGEISGNTAYSPYVYNSSCGASGGGVYVSGRDFTMNSGVIMGNTASSTSTSSLSPFSYGGGVYVSGGDFIMNNGVISGNTASSSTQSAAVSSCGGGVYVSAGTFTITGGEISGNETSSWSPSSSSSCGGGVYVIGSSLMSGGAIMRNTASGPNSPSFGGGVYVSGTFTISGGAIMENTASANSSSRGGGVYMDGIFTMSNGEISGNTASSSYSSSGGGVYISGGGTQTFIKRGGTIYGDTDAIAGNGNATDNTAVSGNGHAVYLDNGKRRDSTADLSEVLYAKYDNGSWSYNGTDVPGIYGDTTGNWEE